MKPRTREHNSSLINLAFEGLPFIEDIFSLAIIKQCFIHAIKGPSQSFQLSNPVLNNANKFVPSLKDINHKLRWELIRYPITKNTIQPSKSQYPKLKGKICHFFLLKFSLYSKLRTKNHYQLRRSNACNMAYWLCRY
jgi:hypothetical protein